MAATGKTPILLYGSITPTNAPAAGNLTNSSDGCEIAINVADKNLFFKDATNAVNTVPIRQSSASSNGWLSSTDWSTFNSKQPAGSYALTTGTLAQFASTTSAQLAGVISDETGSGSLVFAASPTLSGTVTFSGSLGNMVFQPNGAQLDFTRPAASYIRATDASGSLVLSTGGGADRLSIDTSGNTTLNTGNLVIGTSGKGIDFSATAGTGTSELLADYEEGTWTPSISSGFTSPSIDNINAVYTKVGRLVTASCVFNIASGTRAATSFEISGLPYTSGSGFGAGSVLYSAITNTGFPTVTVIPNSSIVDFYNLSGNNVLGTDLTAAFGYFGFIVTYSV